MSNPTPKLILAAAWRALPVGECWQAYQSQLARGACTEPHPWTRRSVATCHWRTTTAPVSAPRA